jgi:hypothetical protein
MWEKEDRGLAHYNRTVTSEELHARQKTAYQTAKERNVGVAKNNEERRDHNIDLAILHMSVDSNVYLWAETKGATEEENEACPKSTGDVLWKDVSTQTPISVFRVKGDVLCERVNSNTDLPWKLKALFLRTGSPTAPDVLGDKMKKKKLATRNYWKFSWTATLDPVGCDNLTLYMKVRK